MLYYASLFVLWVIGAFFTGSAFAIHGEINPHTFDDSCSGDSTLDFWICLLWPLSWLAFAGMYSARVVFEHFDND